MRDSREMRGHRGHPGQATQNPMKKRLKSCPRRSPRGTRLSVRGQIRTLPTRCEVFWLSSVPSVADAVRFSSFTRLLRSQLRIPAPGRLRVFAPYLHIAKQAEAVVTFSAIPLVFQIEGLVRGRFRPETGPDIQADSLEKCVDFVEALPHRRQRHGRFPT